MLWNGLMFLINWVLEVALLVGGEVHLVINTILFGLALYVAP